MKRNTTILLAALALAAATGAQAQKASQGVSKNEIVLGSIQDLSGPIAGFGKQARLGMMLRVDEINEQGGINGRKVKLIVEDSAYDPKKSVLAAQKLVNQDKIFMMIGHIGTAHNMAAMPVQFEKNVINFLPLTAAREMYEPLHRLKYALLAAYYDGMRKMVPKLVKEKGAKKVCTLVQDDEFGLEVKKGTEDGLKDIGMKLVEETTFKRNATDFSSQVQKMQAAGCDMIALGTIIRETIGTIATARKLGYNPVFVASTAAYTELIHKLGGPAMNGLYAVNAYQTPYLDAVSQPVRFWATKYQTKYNEEPAMFSVYGYVMMDLFAQAATKAGANLNTDSFIKVLESTTFPRDMFGGPEQKFSPTNHLGSSANRLSQIVNGRWTVVSDYDK